MSIKDQLRAAILSGGMNGSAPSTSTSITLADNTKNFVGEISRLMPKTGSTLSARRIGHQGSFPSGRGRRFASVRRVMQQRSTCASIRLSATANALCFGGLA